MTLAIALKTNKKTTLGSVRRTREWSLKWDPFINIHNYYIAVENPIYHFILLEYKKRISVQSVWNIQMVNFLFQEIQEIIRFSNIENLPSWDRSELSILVCSRHNIWEISGCGNIHKKDYGIISSDKSTKKRILWYFSALPAIHPKKQKTPKKI